MSVESLRIGLCGPMAAERAASTADCGQRPNADAPESQGMLWVENPCTGSPAGEPSLILESRGGFA